jgi:NADH:ubiquinone oxidoreductase subunit E
MDCPAPEPILRELRVLADKYGHDRTALLPIVQEFQRAHRFVSDGAMQALSDLLGIHPVEVYGVVTFYNHLTRVPLGRFAIRLCRTLACEFKGKDEIARVLEAEVGVPFDKTTPDGLFSLEWANCIGMCDLAPALLVNETVYTQVTPDAVREIIAACRRAAAAGSEKELPT